jgi:toxin-antitoxin system PIN domain toxin
MRALLDVNMLLALFDRRHVHHTRARTWWRANQAQGWASCPLTENGFLRISSQKSYSSPIRLADALALLRQWAVPPQHAFWPDDLSLLDPECIDHRHLLGHRQITDAYLLALAVKHGGRLVTLDRGVSLQAAPGAGPEHLDVV